MNACVAAARRLSVLLLPASLLVLGAAQSPAGAGADRAHASAPAASLMAAANAPEGHTSSTLFRAYDQNRVSAPRVIWDVDRYRMWYDGLNSSAAGSGWSVNLAESPDGIVWTKETSNPVLLPGGNGGWDDQTRFQVAVLKEGAAYKMWYSGAAHGSWQVGYATSIDGIHWDVHGDHPVLSVGDAGSWDEFEADGPAVIKDGSLYKMWYHGCNSSYTACGIGYATSADGAEWHKYAGNPVLVGDPAAWDAGEAMWPAVLKTGGAYRMWYTSHQKIGLATSPDGIHWTKEAGNPVLAEGWNGGMAGQASVLLVGGTYKMWFRSGAAGDSSIGYAESADGVGWLLSPDNPVLTPGQSRYTYLPLAPSSWRAARADMILHNGTVLTMETKPAQAQAIAIRGDSILAVGDNTTILALRGPQTQVIDLGGRTLLPGLADGHTHVLRHAGRAGKSLDEATDLLLSHGLTSVTEMSGNDGSVDVLLAAEAAGQLPLRVNVFASYNVAWLDDDGHWMYEGAWFPEHGPILDAGRRVRIPGVKIFADGAGIAPRGCPAMTIPYPAASTDPSFYDNCFDIRGDLYLSQAELNQAVAMLQGLGFRVAFHTMGDRGIDTVLNAIEYALDGASNSVYRHQIQHSSFLRPDQVDRYAALGVLSSVRGTWNVCDQWEYRERWPDRYSQWANRFALPGRGVHAFAEGDFGWGADPDDRSAAITIDPMMMLWGLVTRQQLRPDGSVCLPEPWVAQHQISVRQALRMLTIEPAYAVSQENVLGSLKPGKFADMVVLSGNPLAVLPDALKDLAVLMTMVGGEVQYCRPGSEVLCPPAL